MLRNLPLDKPLAFIDVETTGLKPTLDRMVELSVLKIHPNGHREYKSHRINPEIPIPAKATSIHGITDNDVVNEPKFRQFAKSLKDFLDDCDISGFNVVKFDLPFIEAEFKRAGIDFSLQNRKFVDVQVLYHLLEPRDLKTAYLKYCGKEMEIEHTAEGDATAAAEILDKQLEMHSELPRSVTELCTMCYPVYENYVDPDGKFVWVDGEVVCNFGKKHNGWKLKDIAVEAPDYLRWIAASDFAPEVKLLVNKALLGEFPHLEIE
ncbi:exonuclease domain-containing protein [Chloroflexota bacterium]